MPADKAKMKRVIRYLFAAWMLLAALLLGTANRTLLTRSSLVVLAPILGFAFLLLFRKEFHLTDCFQKENRTTCRISVALTLLTLLMLSIFDQLRSPLFSNEGLRGVSWRFDLLRQLFLAWNYIGLLGAEVVSTFFCWYFIQNSFLTSRGGSELTRRSEPPFLGIHRWTLLVAAVGLVCMLSVSPGYYDQADTGAIWHSVVDGKWSDNFSIVYLFFVKLCTFLIPTRRIISLVFYFAWLFISNQAIGLLEGIQQGGGKRYAIFSCLVFYPLFYLQTMVRDVAYAMALLALGIWLLQILQRDTQKKTDWIVVGICSFVALAFRHDGILPVGVTFAGIGIYAIVKQRRLIKPLCITGLSVFTVYLLLTQGLAFGLMGVQRNDAYFGFGTPMSILAAVAESGEPIDDPDIALMERVMPLSDWAKAPTISRYTVDMASRTWGVPGERIKRVDTALGIQYIRLSLKYLFRYPAVELHAFFRLNSIVWQIARPAEAGAEEMPLAYLTERSLSNENSAENGYRFTAFSEFTYRYAWFLQDTPVLREVCVRGGISILSLILSVVILIRKRKPMELLACLPAFGVFLSTFLIICAQDPRYILPIQEWALFYLVYAWCSKSAENRQGVDGIVS